MRILEVKDLLGEVNIWSIADSAESNWIQGWDFGHLSQGYRTRRANDISNNKRTRNLTKFENSEVIINLSLFEMLYSRVIIIQDRWTKSKLWERVWVSWDQSEVRRIPENGHLPLQICFIDVKSKIELIIVKASGNFTRRLFSTCLARNKKQIWLFSFKCAIASGLPGFLREVRMANLNFAKQPGYGETHFDWSCLFVLIIAQGVGEPRHLICAVYEPALGEYVSTSWSFNNLTIC